MYCPTCQSEYREGITFCQECQVPLVADLEQSEEEEHTGTGLVLLAESTHPTFVDDVVTTLEQNGIAYVVHSGTALSLLAGPGPVSETMPEDWKAVIWVIDSASETAQKMLDELTDQYQKQGASTSNAEE